MSAIVNRVFWKLAIGNIFHGLLKCRFRIREVTDGADQALLREEVHEAVETPVQLAEQVFLRHLHVIEKQLGSVLALQPHLAQVAATLEAFHAAFDDKETHAVALLRVGARHDDDEVGVDAVRYIGLGAV